MLPRVQRERPDVWDVITRGGKHWIDLCRLTAEESVSSKTSGFAEHQMALSAAKSA